MPKFYPRLSQIVSSDKLPSFFDGFADSINTIFDRFYFRNFQSVKSYDGVTTSYVIELISYKKLKFDIGGSGFSLLLNPDFTAGTDVSVFPLSLSTRWGIKKYIKNFDGVFGDTPQEFFDIFFEVLTMEDRELLITSTAIFVDDADPLTKFITDFNGTVGPDYSLTDSSDFDGSLVEIQAAFAAEGTLLESFIFSHYIVDSGGDVNITLDNIRRFFSFKIGGDPIEKIKELIIPQISARMLLSAGLEVPRSILKPVKLVGSDYVVEEDTNIKTTLLFGEAEISFDTSAGVGFDSEVALNFPSSHPRAQVGNTGLQISFTNAKLDLSDNRNIPEADYDGRPNTFKGVYMQSVSIEMPIGWSRKAGSTVTIIGENVLVGNEGGVSGSFKFEVDPSIIEFDLLGINVTLDSFELELHQNQVEQSSLAGTLSIPGLKEKGTSTDKVLDFEVSFAGDIGTNDETYELRVSSDSGVELEIPNVAEVKLYSLAIGKNNGKWFVELGADNPVLLGALITNQFNIPLLQKFLPQSIGIDKIRFEEGIGLVPGTKLNIDWPALDAIDISTVGGQLSAEIAVHKEIFNTLTIENVRVVFSGIADGTEVNVGIDGGIKLGPIYGSIEDIGLKAEITFPANGGNLGPANIGDFDVKLPTGMGISIDSQGVKGGGRLSFDQANNKYTGTLELTIKDTIDVSAVGILLTKLPDGSDGFSLIIVISAQFNPVQLGFGFTLNGVGGLLGLHRSMNLNVLREGIKNNTLDNILFPTNVVQNASQIISDMDTAFPVKQGRFVFGPMGIIGWGTPTLITAEVGLMIEIPNPVQLAILGVIKALLPDKDNTLLKMQINFLGTVNFNKKKIAFDASLYDSKLITYTLSGDMAFRMVYGNNSNFMLSVGGFHPSFKKPPTGFPSLSRLNISFYNTSNLKIGWYNYFAVTSNTVQFGSGMYLYAKVGPITASGDMEFHALFEFSPFYMTASLSAGVAIKFKRWNLASIRFNGDLSGPTPWKVKGSAKFKVLKMKKTFRLSERTFGQARTITYPDINVYPLLRAALNDRGNWQSTLGKVNQKSVTIKPIDDTSKDVVNSNGTIEVNQKVLPLNFELKRFGNKKPTGEDYFKISSMSMGGQTYSFNNGLSNVKDEFSPGSFKELPKSNKLSAPNFEKFNSGVKLNLSGSGALNFDNTHIFRTLYYDVTLIDKPFEPTPEKQEVEYKYDKIDRLTFAKEIFDIAVQGASSSKSEQSDINRKVKSHKEKGVEFKGEKYVIVSVDDLTIYGKGDVYDTKAEAIEALDDLIRANRHLRNDIQVVPEYESFAA